MLDYFENFKPYRDVGLFLCLIFNKLLILLHFLFLYNLPIFTITFASTVLLYNDVPMEIVSQLLGHSSITTTEVSYGKIIQKKVGEEMRKLNRKLTS